MDPALQVFVNIAELREKVLSNLTVVELIPKSRVCKSWQQSVYQILRLRSRRSVVDSKQLTIKNFFPHGDDHCWQTRTTEECERLQLANNYYDRWFTEIEKSILNMISKWTQSPKILIINYINSWLRHPICDREISRKLRRIYETSQKFMPKAQKFDKIISFQKEESKNFFFSVS